MSVGNLVEAVVPQMGESITDGTLATFLIEPGDRVEVNEPIAQVETDKVLTLSSRTNLLNYKDAFVEKHGMKLGLMSGFVKAAVSARQNQPIVNAVIDGDDIIYRDYIDIIVAVGTPKGVVVSVLRNPGIKNFAEVEKEINTLAEKATDGTI
ncbi:dihydrolipoyllysine-residue succinyltransferase component of 2-oxoglutarate dehydrogenase complex 1 [Olea europaea subsp. europaea]|uniref:Dihydrolipoamide acetyltransferase component of pyruvate dehydrogenase complex n=1 Tax=Olea europaea subsp. europaea TaxID=158383 RepID=A0A8S0TQS3_OLEEU|nr:dihydrolipoyllysine-residue succinyltransferase component of 2-oxoglutarate dehydrogenase complex 1 [Olea europaea subsp. europaea]